MKVGSSPHTTSLFLPGSDPSSRIIRCRDVGGEPTDLIYPRDLPSQGGDNFGRDVTLETYVKALVLPPP